MTIGCRRIAAGPAGWVVALACLSPPRAAAQDPHPLAQGHVFEARVEASREGVLTLDNGAEIRPDPVLQDVASRTHVVLVYLRSGCRIWIEGSPLRRCVSVEAPGPEAPRTPAQLVWIERVAPTGELVVLAGGSALEVAEDAAAAARLEAGEALLIDERALLPLHQPGGPIGVRLRR